MTVLGTTLTGGTVLAHERPALLRACRVRPFDRSAPAVELSATAVVPAIAATPTAIYAGGSFTTIGGQPRDAIAALDPVTGVATPWNPGANGWVGHLLASGGTLFVSGEFTTLAERARRSLISPPVRCCRSRSGPASFAAWRVVTTGALRLPARICQSAIGGQAREGLSALGAPKRGPRPRIRRAGCGTRSPAWPERLRASGGFRVPRHSPPSPVAGFDAVTGAFAVLWTPPPGALGLQPDKLATHSGRIYAGGWMMAAGSARRKACSRTTSSGRRPRHCVRCLERRRGVRRTPLEITWMASDDALGPIAP